MGKVTIPQSALSRSQPPLHKGAFILYKPPLQRPFFGLYYYYVVLCQPDKTEG